MPAAGDGRVHQTVEACARLDLADLISPEALSLLIGAIYDCALDPERWVGALGQLREELHFQNAMLQLQALPSGELLLDVNSGVESPWRERMILHGRDVLDCWGGEATYRGAPFEEPAVLSQINPDGMAVETGNRFAQEWARPQGLIDCMAIVLARDTSSLGSLGLGRHESAGPIGDREVSLGRLLAPHLQRAAAISGLLDARSLVTRSFEALIDRFSVPILLIGPGLQIVHANVAAGRLLETGDPLQSKGSRLAPRSDGVTAALSAAVQQGCADESALGGQGFGIPAYSRDGQLRVLHVLPLQSGDFRAGLAPSAIAAVFVAPTMPGLRAGRVLASLFNLGRPTSWRSRPRLRCRSTLRSLSAPARANPYAAQSAEATSAQPERVPEIYASTVVSLGHRLGRRGEAEEDGLYFDWRGASRPPPSADQKAQDPLRCMGASPRTTARPRWAPDSCSFRLVDPDGAMSHRPLIVERGQHLASGLGGRGSGGRRGGTAARFGRAPNRHHGSTPQRRPTGSKRSGGLTRPLDSGSQSICASVATCRWAKALARASRTVLSVSSSLRASTKLAGSMACRRA